MVVLGVLFGFLMMLLFVLMFFCLLCFWFDLGVIDVEVLWFVMFECVVGGFGVVVVWVVFFGVVVGWILFEMVVGGIYVFVDWIDCNFGDFLIVFRFEEGCFFDVVCVVLLIVVFVVVLLFL